MSEFFYTNNDNLILGNKNKKKTLDFKKIIEIKKINFSM